MRVYNYTTSRKPDKKLFKKIKWLKLRPWKTRQVWTFLFRLSAAGVLLLALLFLYYTRDLPDPNKLLDRQVPESTKILDRNGGLLYEIHGEYKRSLVNFDQIPDSLKHAAVAVEDKDFYKHRGVSITGIIRAALADVLSGKKSQGGSTITQQFVKNAILTKDKSWDRKIREAILSIALEAKFSKNDILKFYLNEIPYGRNAYGAEAAANTYFNKSAKDLSLAESAYLAALPQAPTYYSPYGPHRDALDKRKNTILSLMREQGYITAEQEKTGKEEKVNFSTITTGIKAPHFVLMVQDYLAQKFGEKTLEEGGLKIYTTLDPRLQEIAERAIKDNIEKNAKNYNSHNSALVAIDPKTGQILAMVGSKDYFGEPEPAGCAPGNNCLFEPNVNVALSPYRQPGSSFKPYVYATAFKKQFGYSPASMLIDVTTDFGKYGNENYIPHNYNGNSYGPVSMRQALAGSLNVPAVKTLALVGVENATQTARDLGITSPLSNCGLSLVLGGCTVKLIDHVAAFSVIANEGIKHDKTPILKILNKGGQTLEEYKDNPEQVLDSQAAYEVISIMTDNSARSFIFGANSPLILPGRVVAAKTGTTNDWHDGWTLGFTPSLAAGVWSGNNDGTLLKKGADGVFVAAPIWNQFMKEALKGTAAEEFKIPDGIKKVTVDAVSGKLPTQFTPNTKTEVFANYSVPKNYDDVHIQIAVDSTTGQPANSLTPPELITYQPYTVFHSEKKDNPNWENPVIAWAQTNGYNYPPNDSSYNFNPQPAQNSGNGPTLEIVTPGNGTIVSQLPLKVNVFADSPKGVARVDLSIDGQFIQSLTTQPYNFIINKTFQEGPRAIAAKAVDKNGETTNSSIIVNFALSTPLFMTEPENNASVNFPLTLTAQTANSYGKVDFYVQPLSGSPKLIGSANNISKPSELYRYSLEWIGPLPPGSYKLYSQSGDGVVSPKIKIIVP